MDRKLIIRSQQRHDNALERSEDSSTLNTSFIEQQNLTIRHGSAYFHRLTPSHARRPEYLKDHLELLRCHYNFIRPLVRLSMAMKYGHLLCRLVNFKKIDVQVSILGGYCVLLFCFYSLFEKKTKCENSDFGSLY